MELRIYGHAVLLAALVSLITTSVALAHGGEEGEDFISYDIHALVPASFAVATTSYIRYRIFKGKPSK